MTSNKYNNGSVAGAPRGSSVEAIGLRCLARVAAPEVGLSRVRLSVTEPRCCFPFFHKRRVVASFSFKEEDWIEAPDGLYENSMAYTLVDLAKLHTLQEDLPVKVKWWAGRRRGKTRLDESLGDVLHLLRSCSRLTLHVVATSQQVSVRWTATHAEVTFVNNSSGRTITLPAHDEESNGDWKFPGAWTSEDDQLDEEDLKLLHALSGPSSSLTEGRNSAIPNLQFHTYVNHSTGRFITLPVHDDANNDGWNFPGAWTSEDDKLDPEDLKLLNALDRASS